MSQAAGTLVGFLAASSNARSFLASPYGFLLLIAVAVSSLPHPLFRKVETGMHDNFYFVSARFTQFARIDRELWTLSTLSLPRLRCRSVTSASMHAGWETIWRLVFLKVEFLLFVACRV